MEHRDDRYTVLLMTVGLTLFIGLSGRGNSGVRKRRIQSLVQKENPYSKSAYIVNIAKLGKSWTPDTDIA